MGGGHRDPQRPQPGGGPQDLGAVLSVFVPHGVPILGHLFPLCGTVLHCWCVFWSVCPCFGASWKGVPISGTLPHLGGWVLESLFGGFPYFGASLDAVEAAGVRLEGSGAAHHLVQRHQQEHQRHLRGRPSVPHGSTPSPAARLPGPPPQHPPWGTPGPTAPTTPWEDPQHILWNPWQDSQHLLPHGWGPQHPTAPQRDPPAPPTHRWDPPAPLGPPWAPPDQDDEGHGADEAPDEVVVHTQPAPGGGRGVREPRPSLGGRPRPQSPGTILRA